MQASKKLNVCMWLIFPKSASFKLCLPARSPTDALAGRKANEDDEKKPRHSMLSILKSTVRIRLYSKRAKSNATRSSFLIFTIFTNNTSWSKKKYTSTEAKTKFCIPYDITPRFRLTLRKKGEESEAWRCRKSTAFAPTLRIIREAPFAFVIS